MLAKGDSAPGRTPGLAVNRGLFHLLDFALLQGLHIQHNQLGVAAEFGMTVRGQVQGEQKILHVRGVRAVGEGVLAGLETQLISNEYPVLVGKIILGKNVDKTGLSHKHRHEIIMRLAGGAVVGTRPSNPRVRRDDYIKQNPAGCEIGLAYAQVTVWVRPIGTPKPNIAIIDINPNVVPNVVGGMSL